MKKIDIFKLRGVAFEVSQETEHPGNPYTLMVTLSPMKRFRGSCMEETKQTRVELYDVGEAHCLQQYSHMILVQRDTLKALGSSQISRTASRTSSECNLFIDHRTGSRLCSKPATRLKPSPSSSGYKSAPSSKSAPMSEMSSNPKAPQNAQQEQRSCGAPRRAESFPKASIAHIQSCIGRNIMRGKQEWSHLGSRQAGRQTPLVVDISHFSYDAFRALIVYIYTGDLDLALSYVSTSHQSPQQLPPRWVHLRQEGAGDRYLDLDELRELLMICGKFDVNGLRYGCIGVALSSLRVENAVFMLTRFGRDVEEIKGAVLAFIKDNSKAIIGKDKTLEDLFKDHEDQDCSDLVDELKKELTRTDVEELRSATG
ncbi:hypothetical protein EC968_004944 [Mortierella alpina]|nr:hypothetical protein EC968_004944 [Mortierella alpina]